MPDTPYDLVVGAYSANAENLSRRYNGYDRSDMFIGLDRVLGPDIRHVLDVGAGNGIDAYRFAVDGRDVVAVEPSDLIEIAQRDNHHPRITWFRDAMPALSTLNGREGTFDLVFLNRVFMHVPPVDQVTVLGRLLDFLAPRGCLYMVIRHGPSTDARQMFPVDLGIPSRQIAQGRGMVYELLGILPDYDGRPDISWSFVLVTHV